MTVSPFVNAIRVILWVYDRMTANEFVITLMGSRFRSSFYTTSKMRIDTMTFRFRIKTYTRTVLMISFPFLILSLTDAAALDSGQTANAAATSIPAIDAAAPAEFETASFGLG